MKSKVFFRADGNSQIGLGHVIRSLALVNILKDSYDCIFLIRKPSLYLQELILSSCKLIELPEFIDYAEEAWEISLNIIDKRAIIILDGYFFESNYQKKLKLNGGKVVAIDDLHSVHFYADAIINHNPAASILQYSTEPYTRFYLGLDYLLVREPFLRESKLQRQMFYNESVFICLGGADPINFTVLIARACIELKCFKEINIVVGPAYLFRNELRMLCNEYKDLILLYENLDADEMISVMKRSCTAIAPASSISLEIMCIGINLITGYFVDNQKELSEYIDMYNLGSSLGDFNTLSYNSIKKFIFENRNNGSYKVQKELINGKSDENLLEIFRSLDQQ